MSYQICFIEPATCAKSLPSPTVIVSVDLELAGGSQISGLATSKGAVLIDKPGLAEQYIRL